MKKAICPATKEPMDCKICRYVKNGWCPIWESDKLVNDTINFLREVIEKQNETHRS